MYLAAKNSLRLDEIIKTFEVAYRSHIAYCLKMKYTTVSSFGVAITSINNAYSASSVILSHKIKHKAARIKSSFGAQSDFVDHLSPILTDQLCPIQIDHTCPA